MPESTATNAVSYTTPVGTIRVNAAAAGVACVAGQGEIVAGVPAAVRASVEVL